MKRCLVIGSVFLLVMMGVISGIKYPIPFVVESSPDVAIVYGTASGISALEIVTAGNVLSDLASKSDIQLSDIQLGEVLVNDNGLSEVSSKNLIVLGTVADGCSNSAIAEVLEKEDCSEINLKSGEFLIEVVNNPFSEEKIALLIIGYQVADLVEASRYLKYNSFDTSVGSKYVKTAVVTDKTCTDSDGGKNYNVKGRTNGTAFSSAQGEYYLDEYDTCDEFNNQLIEYYCRESGTGDKTYVSLRWYTCPNGCNDGACSKVELNPNDDEDEESELSKIVGTVQLIYEDFVSTSALNVVVLGNIQTWLNERGLKSEIKKNSEINNDFMKDKLTVFVHDKKAVVIYGEDVTSTLSIVEAGNIYTYLTQQNAVESVCQIIKSDYAKSNDLKDYLCKKEYVPKPILLVYDDNYISTLDLVILGELQVWLKEKNIKSEMKKNSEIDNSILDDRVTVFAYNRETIVIYGKDVPSALDLVSAGNIQIHLRDDKSGKIILVCPELIESSEVNSNDLKDYLCKEILNPIGENPVEIPDEDKYICGACKLDNKCYPLGYRKSGEYCSDDLEFVEQSNAEGVCDNNFECKSNVCVSGECVSEGLINKILNWFKRLFS